MLIRDVIRYNCDNDFTMIHRVVIWMMSTTASSSHISQESKIVLESHPPIFRGKITSKIYHTHNYVTMIFVFYNTYLYFGHIRVKCALSPRVSFSAPTVLCDSCYFSRKRKPKTAERKRVEIVTILICKKSNHTATNCNSTTKWFA